MVRCVRSRSRAGGVLEMDLIIFNGLLLRIVGPNI